MNIEYTLEQLIDKFNIVKNKFGNLPITMLTDKGIGLVINKQEGVNTFISFEHDYIFRKQKLDFDFCCICKNHKDFCECSI